MFDLSLEMLRVVEDAAIASAPDREGRDQAAVESMRRCLDTLPLEGTYLCATGGPGAITVLAACEAGGLPHARDCYMEKIMVGPAARGALDLDAALKQNLKAIARRLQRGIDDLVVVVPDRGRGTSSGSPTSARRAPG